MPDVAKHLENKRITCSEQETTVKPSADNPPIKRSDGTYRPLDTDLVERMTQGIIESYKKNPDHCKHEREFWKEFGDKLPW